MHPANEFDQNRKPKQLCGLSASEVAHCLQRFLHMPVGAELATEQVPHHRLSIDDVSHPSGE